MAILLPNSDVSYGDHWLPDSGVTFYNLLDEGNAHDGYPDTVTCTNLGSLAGTLRLGFEVPAAAINRLALNLHSTTNGGQVNAEVFVNGMSVGSGELAPDTGGYEGWTDLILSGAWDSGDITSLEVELSFTGVFSSCILDSLYINAYTEAGPYTYSVVCRGVAASFATATLSMTGVAAAYNSFVSSSFGITRTGYERFERVDLGLTVFTRAFQAGLSGAARVFNSWTLAAAGLGKWSYLPYAQVASGIGTCYGSFQNPTFGVHRVGYESFLASSFGTYRAANLFTVQTRGVHTVMASFGSLLRGNTRIANASLSRLEIYRGVNAAVDFSAPWQTFTGSSFTAPTLAAGNTYRFAVRRRNEFGLVSANVDEFTLALDGSGNITATPPGGPQVFAAVQIAGPKVRITASYEYEGDGLNQADKWLIWAKVGSAVNPASDTPTIAAIRKADGVGRLSIDLPASGNYTAGNVVHVLVRTRRSGTPSVDSVNTAQVTVTISGSSPTSPAAGIFLGPEFEQRQVS